MIIILSENGEPIDDMGAVKLVEYCVREKRELHVSTYNVIVALKYLIASQEVSHEDIQVRIYGTTYEINEFGVIENELPVRGDFNWLIESTLLWQQKRRAERHRLS
jgi:hypothetical protein